MGIQTLHIIGSNQFGGAERFMVRIVQALNEKGHPAHVLARSHSPIIPEFGAGTKICYSAMRNKWDLLSVCSIRQHIRQLKPEIVQTYMGRASRLTRVPKATGAAHVARLGGYYKIDGYYRHADAWVGNTKGICDYLVGQGLPTNKVFHIGNFVEKRDATSSEDLSALRKTLALPEDALIVFSLGRHIEKKGFNVLIDAFSKVNAEIFGRPVHLLLAGDGPSHKDLVQQSRSSGLEKRVHFLGWQSDPHPFFEMAELFVCPSSDEPLGNVILEGWAHQKPVISTATAGGTELIENGVNGLLVPCEDSQAMAEAINDVLKSDSTGRDQLALAGSQALQRGHSKASVVSAYEDLYNKLIHDTRGAAG